MPHRHHKPGARIFVRFTSFCSRRAACHAEAWRRRVRDPSASHRDAATAKLLRKKKNESWAMRLAVAAISDRRNDRRSETTATRHTSPTLRVGGDLYVHIAQHQNSGERRPLACRVWRLAKHMLSGEPP